MESSTLSLIRHYSFGAGSDNTKAMEHITFITGWKEEFYSAPFCRIIIMNIEQDFAASNLEPIDGGEDADIDW